MCVVLPNIEMQIIELDELRGGLVDVILTSRSKCTKAWTENSAWISLVEKVTQKCIMAFVPLCFAARTSTENVTSSAF